MRYGRDDSTIQATGGHRRSAGRDSVMFHHDLRAEASPAGDNGWRDGDTGLRQADSVAESRIVLRAARTRADARAKGFAWRSLHQRRVVAATAAARGRR